MAEVVTGLQLSVRTVFLLIQSRRQRFPNTTSLNNEFRNGTGVRISTQTVRNRLHEFGSNTRRPAIPLPLTRQHVQDNVRLCQNSRQMDYSWLHASTIAESRFCLDFTDRHQLVWRMPEQRFDELNVSEHGRYGKGSVMIWAGIMVNGKNWTCTGIMVNGKNWTCTLLKTEHWRH